MNIILNLFGGLRVLIGLSLLSFGCFLDFDIYGIGTCIRFLSGLAGAYIIIGHVKYGFGYIVGMIWGLVGYSWAIRSGPLSMFDIINIEGFGKYAIRISCSFLFILGLRDVKD